MAGSLVGAAANFVGGQIQGWASVLDKWAMDRAFKDEIHRQNYYQGLAQTAFNSQLGQAGSGQAQRDLDSAYGARTQAYAKEGAVPLSVNNPYGAPSATDRASADFLESERANMAKYGDWQFRQGLRDTDYERTFNQIANFAGAEAQQVYPYRMYGAQHRFDTLSEAGAAISSIGSGSGAITNLFNSQRLPPMYGVTGQGQPYAAYAAPSGNYYIPEGFDYGTPAGYIAPVSGSEALSMYYAPG